MAGVGIKVTKPSAAKQFKPTLLRPTPGLPPSPFTSRGSGRYFEPPPMGQPISNKKLKKGKLGFPTVRRPAMSLAQMYQGGAQG